MACHNEANVKSRINFFVLAPSAFAFRVPLVVVSLSPGVPEHPFFFVPVVVSRLRPGRFSVSFHIASI